MSFMFINIISPGLRLNEELESKMRKNFAELEKFYDHITGYEVKMKMRDASDERKCELEGRVIIPKSSFFSREVAESFETAFDRVIENLKRQLKWHKEVHTEIW
jgi:putative sigma-54 modulation protein